MLHLSSLLVALAVVSTALPSVAGWREAPGPVAQEEMLPGAVAVTGTALRIDTRDGSGPVLYLAYPKEPGQTRQRLYGAFVTLAQDPSTRLLIERLQRGQTPEVLLVRPTGSGAWHVASFLRP